jgi:large subunit ribosomal protein L15
MKQHELQPAWGSTKSRRRVGRGHGSGRGKTAGRGTKGQNSRTGGGVRPYFEGGQMPLVRRLPFKRGFVNIFRVEFTPVNLDRLSVFEPNTEVTPEALALMGIVRNGNLPVKILGGGELASPLKVKAHAFSASAREKILAVGGTVEEIE